MKTRPLRVPWNKTPWSPMKLSTISREMVLSEDSEVWKDRLPEPIVMELTFLALIKWPKNTWVYTVFFLETRLKWSYFSLLFFGELPYSKAKPQSSKTCWTPVPRTCPKLRMNHIGCQQNLIHVFKKVSGFNRSQMLHVTGIFIKPFPMKCGHVSPMM